MNKVSVAIGVFLLGGFALAAYVLNEPGAPSDDEATAGPAVYFDASAATDERIRALETAVGEERNARQLLEEELRIIRDELDQIKADERQAEEERVADARSTRDVSELRATFQQRREERFSPEGRTQRLIEAGFSPDRAALIVQRESELQMEALQARFDAIQIGQQQGPGITRATSDAMLRAEIGDSEYEMYLDANNRPTSVGVGSVLQASPAQSAGLQRGDRIVSYNGQRVFNILDLNTQTMQGTPGENVLVDIERDGIPMQIVLPRGPLGITGGRR